MTEPVQATNLMKFVYISEEY